MAEVEIQNERVDDLPLIIYWLKQMKIAEIIDENLSLPHGNRFRLSYGNLAIWLLTYIISEADHRQSCVEKWVNEHHRSLEAITEWEIAEKDATDDRCGDLLTKIGSTEEQVVSEMEMGLAKHLVKAYELPNKKARSDTTSFAVYHQTSETGSESSLLKFG